MSNKCKDFYACEYTSDFRQGLEREDSTRLQYFLTVCSEGGVGDCPHKPKIIDKKLKEN